MNILLFIIVGISVQQNQDLTDYTSIFKKLLENEQIRKDLKNPDNIRKLTEGLLYKEDQDNRTNCLDLIFEEYKIFRQDQRQIKYESYIRYMDFLIKLDKEMLNIIQRKKLQKCFSLYRELLKQLSNKRQLEQKSDQDESFFKSNLFSYGTLSLSIVLKDFRGIGMQIRNILEKNLYKKLKNLAEVKNKQKLGQELFFCIQQNLGKNQNIGNILEFIKMFETCYSQNNQIQFAMQKKIIWIFFLLNSILGQKSNMQYDIYIQMFQKLAKDFLKFQTYKQILQGFFQKEKISLKCLKALEKLFDKIDMKKYRNYQFTIINIETILNIDQILKENKDLGLQCKTEIKNTIFSLPDNLQKLSLQLLSNVDEVLQIIVEPKHGISTGLGLGLIMKNYKGIGQSLRKLVDKISDMPVHIKFEQLNQQDMYDLFDCLKQIQILDLMSLEKILKSTNSLNKCIKNKLESIKKQHRGNQNEKSATQKDPNTQKAIYQQKENLEKDYIKDIFSDNISKQSQQDFQNENQVKEDAQDYEIELNLGDDL